MARRTATRRRPSDDIDEEQYREDDLADERDERPTRGRSRRGRDEEEPEPRSRRRSSPREDEEEPEPRSRRSRRDEEDEEPRSRRRSSSRDEEPPARRRSSRDEEPPARRSSSRGGSSAGSVGRGWGAVSEIKSGGDFVDHWDVPQKATLIKFLDDAPFAVYSEHFIEDLPKGTKKSFVCLKDKCPLCLDLGDRAKGYAWFNILDLSDPDEPKPVALRAPVGLAKDIQTYAEDKRTKPINRIDVYFTLHRKREQGARYKLESVHSRDLEEYFDMEPLTEEELDDYLNGDLFTEEQVVYRSSVADLEKIVDMVDED